MWGGRGQAVAQITGDYTVAMGCFFPITTKEKRFFYNIKENKLL